MTNQLLCDDHPLQVLPKLAVAIGLNESMLLQQIHYLITNLEDQKIVKVSLGQRWIKKSYENWQSDYFPFLSPTTIKRALTSLEKAGYIVSKILDHGADGLERTKWYTVDYPNVEKLKERLGKAVQDNQSLNTRRDQNGLFVTDLDHSCNDRFVGDASEVGEIPLSNEERIDQNGPILIDSSDSLNNLDKPLEGEAEKVGPSLNGADAPPPPAIPVATFSDVDLPDPGDYPLSQISAWVCYERQWRTLLDREHKGRKRKNVIGHITQRLTKKPKAVEAYREEAQIYPEKTTWDLIDQAIGDDPEDINFWRRVVKYYIGLGWSKTNVVTMIEFYERREIPSKKYEGKVLNGRTDQAGFNTSQRETSSQAAQYYAENESNIRDSLARLRR